MKTLIQIHFPVNRQFQVEGLDKNNLLISKMTTYGTIKLKDGKLVEIKRRQFPIQEGFASTDYKKQGSTCNYAIVDIRKGRGSKDVSAFVKLSRTRSAATTYIIDGFSLSDLVLKKPAGYEELIQRVRHSWISFQNFLSNQRIRFLFQ